MPPCRAPASPCPIRLPWCRRIGDITAAGGAATTVTAATGESCRSLSRYPFIRNELMQPTQACCIFFVPHVAGSLSVLREDHVYAQAGLVVLQFQAGSVQVGDRRHHAQ